MNKQASDMRGKLFRLGYGLRKTLRGWLVFPCEGTGNAQFFASLALVEDFVAQVRP